MRPVHLKDQEPSCREAIKSASPLRLEGSQRGCEAFYTKTAAASGAKQAGRRATRASKLRSEHDGLLLLNIRGWCRRRDSNPRLPHYECGALPTELLRHGRQQVRLDKPGFRATCLMPISGRCKFGDRRCNVRSADVRCAEAFQRRWALIGISRRNSWVVRGSERRQEFRIWLRLTPLLARKA